jgi:hypothetical protein
VPGPPIRFARSIPGNTPAPVRRPDSVSPACRSSQAAASTSCSASAAHNAARFAATAANTPAAPGPATRSNTSIPGTLPIDTDTFRTPSNTLSPA